MQTRWLSKVIPTLCTRQASCGSSQGFGSMTRSWMPMYLWSMRWNPLTRQHSTHFSTRSYSKWGSKDLTISESYRESFRRKKSIWEGSRMYSSQSISNLLTGCWWTWTCSLALLKSWTPCQQLCRTLSSTLTSLGSSCKTIFTQLSQNHPAIS